MADRIPVPGFVGGTTRLITGQVQPALAINLFQESVRDGRKVQKYFRPAEGIRPFAEVDSNDTTAFLEQDGRAFGATGVVFFEFFADGSVVDRGSIAYDGTKATIVSNGSAGHQVCVCSGGNVYIYDMLDDSFSQIDFDGIEMAMVEFMDGYFFALRRRSRQVYYSELENGLVWDLTFGLFERSWGSDNIAFIKRAGRQLWIVGDKTTEIWADVGDANTPFAPVQGAFVDKGCIAAFTGQRDGETITWLSADERGGGEVVRATGYQPQQISTYSIATMIQASTNVLASAEAFVHQIQGHTFYWLHIEGLDTTPVYDFTEQVWSQRAMWDSPNASWLPHVARCHCYAFEKHFVGVRTSGIIYELSAAFVENGLIA